MVSAICYARYFLSISILLLLHLQLQQHYSSARRIGRSRRNANNLDEPKETLAPLIGREIDLDTVEGIEQVTRLVLIKTDSLRGETEEPIDGRYLNSLTETLYTGLRKPFKSVSADILGIFPSFEEVRVRCEQPNDSDNLERDESISGQVSLSNRQNASSHNIHIRDANEQGLASVTESSSVSSMDYNSTYMSSASASSVNVCRAVTNDCLPMEDLIDILPPSVTSFEKALVRLCPVMLFRIMNQICHRTNDPLRQDDRSDKYRDIEQENDAKEPMSLDTLLRETQILKNLQNSDDLGAKRPQKLHKKLKTHANYKGNSRLNGGGIQQESVDEQLLKIRLKLTEPSIEKVWIFSLLFVVLSIVVSMGGLIVLPFVRKTTRRRILTLFEGLAVGGLAGSATLHMFPQAFGLVDENYHKYFWRIFVVFFGIYLCYLCERTIKIVKVMRTRRKKRSHPSLLDMDLCYGVPSISRDNVKECRNDSDFRYHCRARNEQYRPSSHRDRDGRSLNLSVFSRCGDPMDSSKVGLKETRPSRSTRSVSSDVSRSKRSGSKNNQSVKNSKVNVDQSNCEVDQDVLGSHVIDNQIARQKLIRCLKTVQQQFSPVYAVQTQTLDGNAPCKEDQGLKKSLKRIGRLHSDHRSKSIEDNLRSTARERQIYNHRFIFGRSKYDSKPSLKESMRQKDLETMQYHRKLMGRTNRISKELRQTYIKNRLPCVSEMETERQDQDSAARMSVDTVAWMIVFGDAVLNVIDGLSIGAAFERNILAGISISVAVMLEEVIHRLGTFAVLIRAGMSMQQSLLCTFLSACALFPGLIVGILLSDATEDATPYIFCAAGGIFLYMALVDVMKEMNRSIENAIRKDIKSTLQIFALQNVGIVLAVIFLSFLALYEQAMDFEGYQIQYNQASYRATKVIV